IRYFDRALSVRWSPLGRNYVFTAPGIEQRPGIGASGFTVNVFQPNTNALSTNDRLEAKAAHLHHGWIFVRLKVCAGNFPSRNGCVDPRRKPQSDVFSGEYKHSRFRRTFGKDDRVLRLGTEAVLTWFQPEQTRKRNPLGLALPDQLVLPLIECLLVGRF